MLSSQEEMTLYKHSTDILFKRWTSRKKNTNKTQTKVILKVICANTQGGGILFSVRLRKIYLI